MTMSCKSSARASAFPIPDGELHDAPFYRPADDSAEIKYMQERRKQLGGYMPVRKVRATPLKPVSEAHL